MFSRHIDRNNSGELRLAEIREAASDSTKFDPIFRKALQYAADNFDRLRNLDYNDSRIIGNNNRLTTKDMHAAKVNFGKYRDTKHGIQDMHLVLENFDAIDSNKSGKITYSELENWQPPNGRSVSRVAWPRQTGRSIGGSEELTRADYAARIAETERALKDPSTRLGLK